MTDVTCTRCGQTGHRASHCPWPVEASTKPEFTRRWSAEHLRAVVELYPTGGWWAVHLVTGRTQRSIRGQAAEMGIRCLRSTTELAREALTRKPRASTVPLVPKLVRQKPTPRHDRYLATRAPAPDPRFASVWGYAQGVRA